MTTSTNIDINPPIFTKEDACFVGLISFVIDPILCLCGLAAFRFGFETIGCYFALAASVVFAAPIISIIVAKVLNDYYIEKLEQSRGGDMMSPVEEVATEVEDSQKAADMTDSHECCVEESEDEDLQKPQTMTDSITSASNRRSNDEPPSIFQVD